VYFCHLVLFVLSSKIFIQNRDNIQNSPATSCRDPYLQGPEEAMSCFRPMQTKVHLTDSVQRPPVSVTDYPNVE